jgi:23S rRNA pseudouridine1911/1915/1917 synthase
MPHSNTRTDSRQWIVGNKDIGCRLDHFLRNQEVGPTRSQLKKFIENGHVTVDNEECRPSQKLKANQKIILRIPPPEPMSAEPEDIPLDIRYEDDFLMVVNKQQGLVVHPAPGHPNGTLVNAVLFGRMTRGGDPMRPGIVHRLDKDTSGLMVVAKQDEAHASLAFQFHEHTVNRRYRVLVAGKPPARGEWNTLHGRHPKDRKRFSSKVLRGKSAISHFATLERFERAALLQVTLSTGRTHQVRVHCHDHGYPVLGDPWYGPKHFAAEMKAIHEQLPGQALHAELLGFNHPSTGERLVFESDPPEPFLEAAMALKGLLDSN